MKLSKAQQAVVDKMREGWILKITPFTGITISDGAIGKKIHHLTFGSMVQRGIVEEIPPVSNIISVYRLTEQYKTIVPVNEQAAQYAERAAKEVIKRCGLPTSEIVKQSTIKPNRNEH